MIYIGGGGEGSEGFWRSNSSQGEVEDLGIKWFSGGNMRGGVSHHQQSIEGDFRDRKNITEPNGDQVNVFMTRATKILQPRPPPPSLTQTING